MPLNNLQKAFGVNPAKTSLFESRDTVAAPARKQESDEYAPAAVPEESQSKSTTIDLSSVLSKRTAASPSDEISGRMNEQVQKLKQRLLEDKITGELEKIGITLGPGDYLSFKIDASGTINVWTDYSHLENHELTAAAPYIENALNETKFDDKPLGEALLEYFAETSDVDLEEARQEEGFYASFTLRHDAKTGLTEIESIHFGHELLKELVSFKSEPLTK